MENDLLCVGVDLILEKEVEIFSFFPLTIDQNSAPRRAMTVYMNRIMIFVSDCTITLALVKSSPDSICQFSLSSAEGRLLLLLHHVDVGDLGEETDADQTESTDETNHCSTSSRVRVVTCSGCSRDACDHWAVEPACGSDTR